MTGIETAAIVAAAASSVAGAYVSYQGATNQAKLGEHAEAIKREQLSMDAKTQALQSREQEAERQRRAGLNKAAGQAQAAASGLDWLWSPSVQAGAAEDERLVAGDISSIQLLGAAGQRRNAVEQRTSEITSGAYAAMGSNAWIAPTIGLVGDGAKLGMASARPAAKS